MIGGVYKGNKDCFARWQEVLKDARRSSFMSHLDTACFKSAEGVPEQLDMPTLWAIPLLCDLKRGIVTLVILGNPTIIAK